MKFFVCKIVSFCIFVTFFLLLLLVMVPNKTENIIYKQWEKRNLLIKSKPPRLIIVGGSNVTMGYVSSILEDSLNMDVINMGGFLSMGINLVIDNIYDYVEEGDIILLQPEYENFSTHYDGNPKERIGALFLKYNNYESIKLLDLGQLYSTILSIPSSILFNIKDHNNDIPADSIYDSNGDEIRNRIKMIKSSEIKTCQRYLDPNKFSEYYMYKFVCQIKSLHDKGAIVLVSPSFYHIAAYEANKDFIDVLDKKMAEKNIPYIVSPKAHTFPDKYYYNTPHHLNFEGAKYYTKIMAYRLKRLSYFKTQKQE